MKKIILAVSIIAVMGSMVSCKPKEKCPAYGNLSKAASNKTARS